MKRQIENEQWRSRQQHFMNICNILFTWNTQIQCWNILKFSFDSPKNCFKFSRFWFREWKVLRFSNQNRDCDFRPIRFDDRELFNFQQLSTIFKLEMIVTSTVEAIKFLKSTGICDDEKEMSNLTSSVDDSGGVYFISKVSGSLESNTPQRHIICRELCLKTSRSRWVSFTIHSKKNWTWVWQDLICQEVANCTGIDIVRSENCSELTSIGCNRIRLQLQNSKEPRKRWKFLQIWKNFYSQKGKIFAELWEIKSDLSET